MEKAEANYAELDAIIKATGAKIIHNGQARKPRFHRLRDKIVLPLRSFFQDEAHYRASLSHEVLHFLEQPNRLGWIGSSHQSELVCEAGTGLMESYLRLPATGFCVSPERCSTATGNRHVKGPFCVPITTNMTVDGVNASGEVICTYWIKGK